MELELGLKFSKDVDDFTSTDLRIAKDRAGIVFVSKETDTMFVLTADLTGYKREQIKIEINDEGTRITVSAEKPVQETVIVGWKLYKKGIEMRGFKKIFKIPDGVILNQIKAKFNEQDSVLTVSMPKSINGVRGSRIEEVDDEEEEEKAAITEFDNEKGEPSGSLVPNPEKILQDQEKEVKQQDPPQRKQELDEIVPAATTESTDEEQNAKKKEGTKAILSDAVKLEEEEEAHLDETSRAEEVGETSGNQPPERSSIFCAPIIAGSALIVSIIVFVFHFIRTKEPPTRKKN